MSVEDVFTISGRGTVCTGRVERGQVKLNDEVEIVGLRDTKNSCNWNRNVQKIIRLC